MMSNEYSGNASMNIEEWMKSLRKSKELEARVNDLRATIAEQARVIQRVAIAANEMDRDNRKGDFELSPLARIDLDCILAALNGNDDA